MQQNDITISFHLIFRHAKRKTRTGKEESTLPQEENDNKKDGEMQLEFFRKMILPTLALSIQTLKITLQYHLPLKF